MQSERLVIISQDHPSIPSLDRRTIYLGFDKHGDWPGVLVSMSVWHQCYIMPNYVDWIQVSDAMRGHGYGQELIKCVQRECKLKLFIDPTSESCERMLERMQKAATLAAKGDASHESND